MKQRTRIKVIFVCMGNLCRSPTAEAVFRSKIKQAGMTAHIECASAGTHDYHVGSAPDRRSQTAALQRGYDMSTLRGKQVGANDFHAYDYVLAMDEQNLATLKRICPEQHLHKLHLFSDFDQQYRGISVPDPYYGSGDGFETVLDMIEQGSDSLLTHLIAGNSPPID